MQIQIESISKNTIRSYTERQIVVDGVAYEQSILIGQEEIIYPWDVASIQMLNETLLEPMLKFEPEVILIGHHQIGQYLPQVIVEYLSKKRIGIECMSIGAACRTFNVLLAEHRRVVIGLIFSNHSQEM